MTTLRLLHDDIAPAHNALSKWHLMFEKNIAMLQQTIYSPDTGRVTFFSFSKLRSVNKRNNFKDVKALKRAVTTELRGIQEESFQQQM